MKTVTFLSFIFLSSVSFSATDICYDENNAFASRAPQGWIADTKKAAELGICVVYYQEGKTFDTSPAIIYPRLTSTVFEGTKAIKSLFENDAKALKTKSAKLKIIEKPNIKNKAKMKFEVREFLNGPEPQEFEAVAYHAGKKSVFVAVLSTRKQKDFDENKKKLTEFVQLITPLDANELKKINQ